MIAIFNKFRIGMLLTYLMLAILTASVTLVSCSKDDELEIQNDFPFEVNVMPIPKDVANGQTVEIRITIQRTAGNYSNTQYFLRYFQFDGQGTLRYYDEPPYLPNDLYQLPTEQFRLYYTSTSAVSQSFEVWISDSFGNEKQVSFQFNSSD
ncbi:conjugal transfer protein TraQ [Elizabethkingia anophelis]|nr:conjugal transfer protein TraQ [Elizabethkingia anophelis]MDV3970165.1 conjugal transfer protein TraQ [Elizabethkingia anophelis]